MKQKQRSRPIESVGAISAFRETRHELEIGTEHEYEMCKNGDPSAATTSPQSQVKDKTTTSLVGKELPQSGNSLPSLGTLTSGFYNQNSVHLNVTKDKDKFMSGWEHKVYVDGLENYLDPDSPKLKNLFDYERRERRKSNLKLSQMKDQEHILGEDRIKNNINNILSQTTFVPSPFSPLNQNYQESSSGQLQEQVDLPIRRRKQSMDLNLTRSFNISDKTKRKGNSLFKISLPKRLPNKPKLSAMGAMAQEEKSLQKSSSVGPRYSSRSTFYECGGKIYVPKLSLLKYYPKPSRHVVVDKTTLNDTLVKKLIKNENMIQSNIGNTQCKRKLAKLDKQRSCNLPVLNDSSNVSLNRTSLQKKKSDYFTPKSYAEIKRDVIEKSTEVSCTPKNHSASPLMRSGSLNESIMMTTLLKKQSFYSQSQIGFEKAKKSDENMRMEMDQTKKFMELNLTRYTINELKSLHMAVIQNSKGNSVLLKKGLIVAMNMCGILIEEERLHRIRVQNPNKNKSNGQQKSKLKKMNSINTLFLKSTQNLSTMRNINLKKSSKNMPSECNIMDTIGVNIQSLLNENINKIVDFEVFLKVFKLIETHYFKQTIIDYLTIIMNSVISRKTIKKKPTVQIKNTFGSCSDLSSTSSLPSETDIHEKQLQDIQIGYNEIFTSFKTRTNVEGAKTIADLFENKIKSQCKEDIRYLYVSQKGKQVNKQTQRNNCGIQEVWKIRLSTLYNLCYSDNELCQVIYDYYVNERNKDAEATTTGSASTSENSK